MRDGRFKRVRVLAIVKWASAAMVVGLLIAWALSLVWWAKYTDGRTQVILCSHCAIVDRVSVQPSAPGMWRVYRPQSHFKDGLTPYLAAGQGFLTLRVPFWCLLPVPIALLIAACVLDARNSSKATHACKRCGYSRTGLAPGAACPECGTSAPA